MKRVALLSAGVLLASLGANGPPEGLCGHGIGEGQEPGQAAELWDTADGGLTDSGLVDSGGKPDGSAIGGSSGKALHLIHAGTGEDLGLLVDLKTLTVFSEKFSALIELGTIQPTQGAAILFSEADCNGKRYVAVPAPRSPPAISNYVPILGPQATYLQPTGPALRNVYVGSILTQQGMDLDGTVKCSIYGKLYPNDVTEYVDTRIKRRPADSQLKVELR